MYTLSSKVAFFDSIAKDWDKKLDLPALQKNLVKELKRFDIQPSEHVMDIGCGTGNLSQALLDVLGADAQVTAVEISMDMLLQAQNKIHDPRMHWQVADVTWPLPFMDEHFDRVMCYQVWPHINQPEGLLKELLRVLKPGGKLHIWHTDSRDAVNHTHAHANNAEIANDVLPPAEKTAEILKKAGFVVSEASESDKHYLVSAHKP